MENKRQGRKKCLIRGKYKNGTYFILNGIQFFISVYIFEPLIKGNVHHLIKSSSDKLFPITNRLRQRKIRAGIISTCAGFN